MEMPVTGGRIRPGHGCALFEILKQERKEAGIEDFSSL